MLAEIVREAVLATEGVAGLEDGPEGLVATTHGEHRVRGVLCVANNLGGCDLRLRLVCHPVPLRPLAARMRERVRRAAWAAGASVGRVDVDVADVLPSQVATDRT